MQTKIRTLDGLPIEEPLLDEEGREKQRALAELAMKAYEETGSLTGAVVSEKVTEYEAEIGDHLVD